MLIYIRVSLLTKPTATDGLDAGWSLLCCKMMTRPQRDLELLARRGTPGAGTGPIHPSVR